VGHTLAIKGELTTFPTNSNIKKKRERKCSLELERESDLGRKKGKGYPSFLREEKGKVLRFRRKLLQKGGGRGEGLFRGRRDQKDTVSEGKGELSCCVKKEDEEAVIFRKKEHDGVSFSVGKEGGETSEEKRKPRYFLLMDLETRRKPFRIKEDGPVFGPREKSSKIPNERGGGSILNRGRLAALIPEKETKKRTTKRLSQKKRGEETALAPSNRGKGKTH